MYTFRKWVFTKVALGEFAGGVLVSIISLFLAVSVYYDIRFYIEYNRALSYYASGRLEKAGPAIEAATRYRPDFAPARELAAKIKIDSVTNVRLGDETLKEAGALLERNLNLRGQKASAATHLGLAAIHLKMYDIARFDKAANADAELKAAETSIDDAEQAESGLIDISILKAQLALRTGKYKEAEQLLAEANERIRKTDGDIRDLPTVDSLVDLYVGVMAVQIQKKDWSAARESALRIQLLRPDWDITNANVAAMESRRFAEDRTLTVDDISRRLQTTDDLVQKLLGINLRDPVGNAWAKTAAYSLTQSLGLAYARCGDTQNPPYHFNNARGIDADSPTVYVNWINCLFALRQREDLNEFEKATLLSNARNLYEVYSKLNLTPQRRLTVYNNMGVVSFEAGDLKTAQSFFERSLKEAQDNGITAPVVWRNLAVVFGIDRVTEAVEAGKTALKLDPSQTDLKEWLESLK